MRVGDSKCQHFSGKFAVRSCTRGLFILSCGTGETTAFQSAWLGRSGGGSGKLWGRESARTPDTSDFRGAGDRKTRGNGGESLNVSCCPVAAGKARARLAAGPDRPWSIAVPHRWLGERGRHRMVDSDRASSVTEKPGGSTILSEENPGTPMSKSVGRSTQFREEIPLAFTFCPKEEIN